MTDRDPVRPTAGFLPPGEDPERPEVDARSPFLHPEWTVGVVLILGAVSLLLGVLGDPLWLLAGSPFVLTLAIWIVVRIVTWRRRVAGGHDAATPDD